MFLTPGPYPCIRFLAPLLTRAGSGASLGGGFPAAFFARPGAVSDRCVQNQTADIVIASDVVIRPSDFNIPGLPVLAPSVGEWIAASEVGVWMPNEGIRYAGVDPGAALPLVRSTIVETSLGLEALEKLNDCPNCPCPFCAPLAYPMAGTPELAMSARGAASVLVDEPGVLVLSSTRRTLWRLGGVESGVPRQTIGMYFPDEDTWHSIDVGERLGHVLSATYSAPDDVLYVLSEQEVRETVGRGRNARELVSRRLRLLRLDPDTDATEVVGNWPRLTHNDVFAMAVTADGELWIAGSRSNGPSHVALLLRVHGGHATLRGGHSGRGGVTPYGARASDEGLTLVVERAGLFELVAHHLPTRPDHGLLDRCF